MIIWEGRYAYMCENRFLTFINAVHKINYYLLGKVKCQSESDININLNTLINVRKV